MYNIIHFHNNYNDFRVVNNLLLPSTYIRII